ncbi:hypothetical protein Btru_031267 [Bulinus truncatus]|nr:hypothetical protein Btru_031267 [Bulinus truncatus]
MFKVVQPKGWKENTEEVPRASGVSRLWQERAPIFSRYPAYSLIGFSMADITLRLIWYKLGEVREKMADTSRTWYTELDFDSYVLDLLLLGWCTLCFIVILAVNAIVAAFGPLQRQPREKFREITEGETSLTGAALPLETAQWFNNAVNWFYLHYYHAPEFVDEWVKSLNEQVVKLGVSIIKLDFLFR